MIDTINLIESEFAKCGVDGFLYMLKIKGIQDTFAFVVTDPHEETLKKHMIFTAKINKVQNEEDVKNIEITTLENTNNTLQPTKNNLASKFTW